MYVCICRAVTDQQVKAAIDAGARTVPEVTRACCAGDDCGACHQVIEGMIEDARVEAMADDPREPATADGGVRRLPVVRERAA